MISYQEMKEALKNPTAKQACFLIPTLPKGLAPRKREILQLYQDLEQRKRKPGEVKVAPGVVLPDFEEALRLCYPKDSRERLKTMTKWIDDVLFARQAQIDARVRASDNKLIEKLDADGNGLISLQEFMELSKITGLSKASMRARFRDKDFGNAGELNREQMVEVLEELRYEAKLRGTHAKKDDQVDLVAELLGPIIPT